MTTGGPGFMIGDPLIGEPFWPGGPMPVGEIGPPPGGLIARARISGGGPGGQPTGPTRRV